jgi:hypothetical protein
MMLRWRCWKCGEWMAWDLLVEHLDWCRGEEVA